jgi:hypothetical protein
MTPESIASLTTAAGTLVLALAETMASWPIRRWR